MARTTTADRRTTHPAEADTLAFRPIAIAAAALLILLVACAGAVTLLQRVFVYAYDRSGPAIDAAALPHVTGPEPQPAPQADLVQYRADKSAWLNGYGWVDRPGGVVHLPIERAMALIVQRHAPAAPQP